MEKNYFRRLILFWLSLLLFSAYVYSQAPAYYNGTDITQTGDNLKTNLATLIATNVTNLSYTLGVWNALMQTDLDPTDPTKVILIYGYDDTDTDIRNDRTRGVTNNGGNVGDWNREHIFPRSLGNPNLGSTGPGSDAHHLRPSDVQFNSLRSNNLFADGSGNAGLIDGNKWYPGDEFKGDIARMMMYMYLRYGNQCLPSAVGTGAQTYHPDMMDIFIEWNVEDPVSQLEINRNVLLEGIQGNRNPFIDNPAFATAIWGGPQAEDRFAITSTDIEAPTAPVNLVFANTTATTTVLSWGAATDNVGVTAYQIFNGATLAGVVTGTTFTATELLPNTTYTFTIKALDAANNISESSNNVVVTTKEEVIVTPPTGDFIAFQGYEGAIADTWSYVTSPITCNDGGNDVWDVVSSVGFIGAASTGANFFGVRDLEGNCGTSSGGTLSFDSVDVSGYSDVALSFNVNVVGYDVANGDSISYEIFYDEVSQGAQIITEGSPYSTTGWETITTAIPNTVTSVKLTLFVKQNGGSDYAGFDDIKLEGTATAPPVPSILINEIDVDTPSTDTMEFVELYDGGVGNTALDGLVLVFYNGSNNQSYAAYDLDGYTTNAEGYFVIGNAAVPNVSIVIPSNGLQNGADAVALYTGDATDFPNNSAITITNIVDAFVYDTNDSDDAELLVLLNAGEAQINEGELGDKDNHSSQRVPNGTGGARNTASYTQLAPTPGAENGAVIVVPPTLASILINELDADTEGTDTMEFVELYDGGVGNTVLDGFVLVFYNGSNNQSYAAYDLDGYTTNAEGYFVIGNTAVPNVSIVIPSNGLQNGADAVALYMGDATDFPNNSTVTTNNLIDALVYDTNDSDDVELLVLLNAGEAQINEGGAGDKDSHSLQRFANGSGEALSTSTYVQAIPTPGAENGAILPPPTAISILEARNTIDGEVITVSGVLTVVDEFFGSAYLQDESGAIAIFDELVHGDGVFMVGDSITVTGTRATFREQIQIGTVTHVENNGTPNNPIEPLTITLNELANHPAELVRIENPSFPDPGDILFGNSNYQLTDASGTGELRIDNDVEAIVGLGQPETCTEITGVVGRFFEIHQILPRSQADMSCAEEYVPPTIPVQIPKDETFDVVAWNIEWFGDEANSPAAGNSMSDAIQKDSTKAVIRRLNADVYTVEEIADDALFAQMVNELPGYDYVLSPAVSRPNDTGVKQKVGFIYNTTTVNVVETKVLLESIHPLYNGGDDSALVDYPSTTDRFYASGRLPFLMTADVTIDGATEQINLVALHARANSGSDAQGRYDMRKYDVEVLKDTLDAQYANSKLILLGDYNDDVDETVADITVTTSSFEVYTADTTNYNIVSSTLSDAGFRSFVFRENMIDHIAITNELEENYINESVRVHYEFYDSDYATTTSDHFPVSARFQLKGLELVSITGTDVTCNETANGTATVVVTGGSKPYSYEWNNGQTTETVTALVAGTYSVIVTDTLGSEVTEEVLIEEPTPIRLSTTANTTVFLGYLAASCTTIGVTQIDGGVAPYTYEWNTKETTEELKVCPEETTTYSVIVTDAKGCTATAAITVDVDDVRCGNNPNKQKVQICYRGRTFCMPQWKAERYIKYYGATLGSCDGSQVVITNLKVYPNSIKNNLNIKLKSNEAADVKFVIFNCYGAKVFKKSEQLNKGETTLTYNLRYLSRGHYYLKVLVNGKVQKTRILVKR